MFECLCIHLFEFFNSIRAACLSFLFSEKQDSGFWFLELWKDFSHFEVVNFVFWKMENRRRAPEHDEDPYEKPLKSWIWISYLSKTWNRHLVTFLFSSKGPPSTPQHFDSHPCIRSPSWRTQRTRINDGRVSLGETSELECARIANMCLDR